MKQQLENGTAIPENIKSLVSITESDQESSSDLLCADSKKDHTTVTDKIYFPLPASREQKEIAHRLSRSPGVLVQGPPGTGKSHTIANLICHLLATGKKILVTSKTTRALKVLKNKIPEEIGSLCVSLLGDDRGSLKSLEDSVRKITNKYCSWDKSKNQQEIKRLEWELDKARKDKSRIYSNLIAVREKEIYHHPLVFETYKGSLQSI
ncbi:unnamed protein product, partial [marine sediment metagenome]